MRQLATEQKTSSSVRQNSLNQLHSVRGSSDRSQFVVEETINIYPDTLVWVRDYTYGFQRAHGGLFLASCV